MMVVSSTTSDTVTDVAIIIRVQECSCGHTLGEYVSTFRRLRGLTAAQMADRAGINTGTLNRLKKGDASVGLDVLLEACRALGILDFMLTGLNPYETALGQSLAEQNLTLPKRVRR